MAALAVAYQNLPTLWQWKKDSAVGGILLPPYRRNDPVLSRIDRLVSTLYRSKTSGEAQYLLSELFFTTMYWNNHYKQDPKMEAGRRDAIMRLMLYAANTLSAVLGCAVGGLASRLSEIFGTGMSAHGRFVDEGNEEHYLSTALRESFRVLFLGGKAWRFNCLEYRQTPNVREPLKLVDTSEYAALMEKANADLDERIAGQGKAGYVLSMSREFYVGPFILNRGFRGRMPRFHSYFMGGRPTQCAGIVRITNGEVVEIDNESGHYQPIDTRLAHVLEFLRSVGQNLSKIRVRGIDREKKPIHARGDRFLATHGNWEALSSIP